jgi:hypothetical protein
MKIGWHVGPERWAFQSVVNHLVARLRMFAHVINEDGDLTVLMSPEQLRHRQSLSRVVLHLDSARQIGDADSGN